MDQLKVLRGDDLKEAIDNQMLLGDVHINSILWCVPHSAVGWEAVGGIGDDLIDPVDG